MKQLLFRVTGTTQKHRKKLQQQIESSTLPATTIATKALALLAVGGVSIYGLGLVLPEMTKCLLKSPSLFSSFGKRMVCIDGNPIIGTSVLLIRDRSGSMTPDRQTKLNKQVEKLEQGRIEVLNNQYAVSGLGVNSASSDNLLGALETALKSEGKSPVDTIYAFSDFEVTSSSNWFSNDEGYQQLEKLLEENKLRLYLGTVEYQPPEKLVMIARQSAGGLINTTLKNQGENND